MFVVHHGTTQKRRNGMFRFLEDIVSLGDCTIVGQTTTAGDRSHCTYSTKACIQRRNFPHHTLRYIPCGCLSLPVLIVNLKVAKFQETRTAR